MYAKCHPWSFFVFFFQAEDGIRDTSVTGVQTCALPICLLPVPGVTAVVSAASFTSSAIAPGELVTIFGNSIGPSAPVGLVVESGKVETSLTGLTVGFDGTLAPLLYATAGQINAVVPFAVAGKSTTLMRVSAPDGAT